MSSYERVLALLRDGECHHEEELRRLAASRGSGSRNCATAATWSPRRATTISCSAAPRRRPLR